MLTTEFERLEILHSLRFSMKVAVTLCTAQHERFKLVHKTAVRETRKPGENYCREWVCLLAIVQNWPCPSWIFCLWKLSAAFVISYSTHIHHF